MDPRRSVDFLRFVFLCLALSQVVGIAQGAVPAEETNRPIAMAFATWDQLFMAIGRYQPGKGWQGYRGFVRTTYPGDVFTLYTMEGEVAQVRNVEQQAKAEWRIPVEWSAPISKWAGRSDRAFALALYGVSPVKAESARAVPLDDAALVARVSAYLKQRKLDVPAPYLTQAYEVTLAAGERPAYLVCAHSDASALRDDQPAAVYAVALIITDQKIIPLIQQTSVKTRDQSIDEYQRYNGTRDFLRFVAALDIDGDGGKELVVYAAQSDFSQIDVFSYTGKIPKKVISVFKHLYN